MKPVYLTEWLSSYKKKSTLDFNPGEIVENLFGSLDYYQRLVGSL